MVVRPPSTDPATGRPAARYSSNTSTGFNTVRPRTGFGVHETGGIRVQGITDAKRRLNEMKKESHTKMKRGLHNAGAFLKQESQKLVPVDTGYLRSTAYFRVHDRKDGPFLDVGYRAPYAVRVHEDLHVFHRIGQAKFLEQPAREYAKTLLYLVEVEMRKRK